MGENRPDTIFKANLKGPVDQKYEILIDVLIEPGSRVCGV